MKIKISIILYSTSLLLFSLLPVSAEDGKLCIGPIVKPNSDRVSLANPQGGNRSFKFSVQVDDKDIIELPFNQNTQYRNLEIGNEHILKIRNDGKIIESFKFNFQKYKTHELCLWFKPLYETWSLWPANESKHLCECNK